MGQPRHTGFVSGDWGHSSHGTESGEDGEATGSSDRPAPMKPEVQCGPKAGEPEVQCDPKPEGPSPEDEFQKLLEASRGEPLNWRNPRACSMRAEFVLLMEQQRRKMARKTRGEDGIAAGKPDVTPRARGSEEGSEVPFVDDNVFGNIFGVASLRDAQLALSKHG